MQLLDRWRRSHARRGTWGTLTHIPVAATRPLVIALRKRRTCRRLAAWIQTAPHPRKVHIACGHDRKDGWLNTDLYFSEWCIDAREPLPFPDLSIDYFYCQHFVEHLNRDQGCFFFRQCRRVLLTDGVLRISTPDLAAAARRYLNAKEAESRRVINYVAEVEFGRSEITPCQCLNAVMRMHDHLHLFDFEDLSDALRSAGFAKVLRVPYGESEKPELRNLESRYLPPDNDWLQPLDLVVEASGIA